MAGHVIDCSPYQGQLEKLALALPKIPRADMRSFLEAAREISSSLPSGLASPVDEFNVNGNRPGYLLLRHMPVESEDELLPTPSSTPPPAGRPLLKMEAMLSIIGSRLGLLSAYDQGYGNRRASSVIHDLYPTRTAHPLSAENTKKLDFHSDLSHHARQPSYIILACSRADHERVAATLLASIRNALPLLSVEVKNLLLDRVFTRPIEENPNDPSGSSNDFAKFKVLHGDREDPFLCYERTFLRTENSEDAAALAELSESLESVAEPVILVPGDVLIIDNLHTTHARTAFTGRWDGKDRWLSRAYVRTNRNGQLSGGERAGDEVPFIPRR